MDSLLMESLKVKEWYNILKTMPATKVTFATAYMRMKKATSNATCTIIQGPLKKVKRKESDV